MIARVLTAAIGLCALLTGALAYWHGRQPPTALPPPTGGAAPGTAVSVSFAAPAQLDPARFTELLARPPFSPDRRPAAAGGAAQTAGQSGTPAPIQRFEARLLGVINDGTERFAVLAPVDAGPTEFVRPGARIEGWTVDLIDDRRVVLRQGAVKVEILLFEPR
jgi:hypothetical protein